MKTDENESANLITQIVNFVLPEVFIQNKSQSQQLYRMG